MRSEFIFVLCCVAAAGCSRQTAEEAFEARALGAAYWRFPRSAVDLVVSKSSGRPAACGYARGLQGGGLPGQPFVWVDGEMYAGERLYAMKEAEVIRLCGPNWVAPRAPRPAVSSAGAPGTPAARDRSPAA